MVLQWQFVPAAGVFDWRTPVRDALASWRPRPRGAGEAGLWVRVKRRVRELVGRADPLNARMAADLAAALWQLAVFYHRRGLG
ncbi:hypothetical protein ACWGJW_22505 [Streptomyces nigrescens]